MNEYYTNMEEEDKKYTAMEAIWRYKLAYKDYPGVTVTDEMLEMEPIFYRLSDALILKNTDTLKFVRAAINHEIQRRKDPPQGPFLI